jgi:hypothetical protein
MTLYLKIMQREGVLVNKTYILYLLLLASLGCSEVSTDVRIVSIGEGWAKNAINAVIFRRNAVVTHKEDQFAAYYDADAYVVVAKRKLGSENWEIRRTQYKGNVKDAHNSISIMVDGAGYVHMSWDHHNDSLRYCRSTAPGSLEFTEKMPMTGIKEDKVTYPEFYRLQNGNLLFLYRDGASGRGNLMMNHYNIRTKKWTQRQDAFIDGEGQRNAYWQMCTDTEGAIHISWVWRETGDVATNHDMCYAKSIDEGLTWQKSNGEEYNLPITASNAEYAARIPQKSELANTTSMCADSEGRPYVAIYWRPEGKKVPQYHLLFHDGDEWQQLQISNRTTPFSLSGRGEKRIPISRCQILADSDGPTDKAYMLFRDIERADRVSVAICEDLQKKTWKIRDLTDYSVRMWEPSYDTELWKNTKNLHVFLQKVGQGDGGALEDIPPQEISILEWKPE